MVHTRSRYVTLSPRSDLLEVRARRSAGEVEGDLIMSLLKLDPDELLTTTRAVRKRLDFDRPVERSVIEECLRIALQAPTGGNRQQWHFVVVTDPAQAPRDRRSVSEGLGVST